MKKIISVLIGLLFVGSSQLILAKDLKWQDETVDVSEWRRIVLVDLVNLVTEKYDGAIGWVSDEMKGMPAALPEDIDQKVRNEENSVKLVAASSVKEKEVSVETMTEQSVSVENEKEEDLKDKEEVFGFEAAEMQWQLQAERKLGKKIEWISFADCLTYLETKDASRNWRALWKNEREVFWQEAEQHLSGYVDGFLVGELISFGEGSVYIAPTTRSVQVNQGGTFRNHRYYPRYVTQYYTTPGYDVPTWTATGKFSLLKIDGTSVWFYQKSANKKQKEWFHRKKQDSFFADFFARVMSETPLD